MDGYIHSQGIYQSLDYLDALIFYTPWAEREFYQASEKFGFKTPYLISNISHGIDQDTFCPRQVKNPQAILGSNYDPQICYLLNANRYNERKDLLSTIKGFALAKSEFKRETKLVMHPKHSSYSSKSPGRCD